MLRKIILKCLVTSTGEIGKPKGMKQRESEDKFGWQGLELPRMLDHTTLEQHAPSFLADISAGAKKQCFYLSYL